MAQQVIKKDGSTETFDPEKIKRSIAMAADRLGLDEVRKNTIIEEVSGAVIGLASTKEEITTSEIRERIFSELVQIEPSVVDSWKRYEQEKKGA